MRQQEGNHTKEPIRKFEARPYDLWSPDFNEVRVAFAPFYCLDWIDEGDVLCDIENCSYDARFVVKAKCKYRSFASEDKLDSLTEEELDHIWIQRMYVCGEHAINVTY